jgi:5-methylcytosine-specific restriction endonuclease McrA
MHLWRLRERGAVGSATKERGGEFEHGTVLGYKSRGCRCDECRAADRLAKQEWRAKNRDTQNAMQTRYRLANPKRVRAYKRRWARANPDKSRSWDPVRAQAPFDAEALEYCELIANDPCVYCGAPSTDIDHIEPVSVSRSSHWTNLAPACDSCNSSKGAKPLLDFLAYRLRVAAVLA